MDVSTSSERQEIINQVIGARTFEQISEARQALMGWIEDHPDEQGIEELEEHLAHLENALGQQTAQATAYLTTEPNQPG